MVKVNIVFNYLNIHIYLILMKNEISIQISLNCHIRSCYVFLEYISASGEQKTNSIVTLFYNDI